MPIVDLHKEKDFRDSTKTKLDIFENYLTEWLPAFLFNEPEVNICDFFAGPGTDIFGNPGSPIRIFNVIQKYKRHILKNNVRINVVLNEQQKDKFRTLQENVDSRLNEISNQLRELITVKFHNGDFQDVFPALEDGLKNGPNLFFFDQNGVKHITVELIKHLETFNKTDYLFFASSGYFKRFEFKNFFPNLNIKKENIKYSEIHRGC